MLANFAEPKARYKVASPMDAFLASKDLRAGISPLVELGAYERLWLEDRSQTFAKLALRFREAGGEALPSLLAGVGEEAALATAESVRLQLQRAGIAEFGVRLPAMAGFPLGLRRVENPVELLYFRGLWQLADSPLIAVVGTGKPSEEGLAATRELAGALVSDGWTIASGFGAGIDVAAHEAALAAGGRTVAVLGTPLDVRYPRANSGLLERIAQEHLVLSQVPVLFYKNAPYPLRPFFFLERCITLSALCATTVIVEGGEAEETAALFHASAALAQGRQLMIEGACFESGAAWPQYLADRGAIRVDGVDEVRERLHRATVH